MEEANADAGSSDGLKVQYLEELEVKCLTCNAQCAVLAHAVA